MSGTKTNQDKARVDRELNYLKGVAEQDTESIWGWGTPAGQLRAKRRADLVIQGAGLKPGMRVLEIGCGTGLFSEIFCQTGIQLIAVDISPEVLEKAIARGLPENKVKFLAARFEECEVEGPFDAVIGSSVLHHLVMDRALSKIFNMLKPGGALSFAEPNMLNPQIFIERSFPQFFSSISPDETAFIRWQLRALLLKSGFASPKIIPFDWLHPATPPSLIPLVSQLGAALERTYVVKEFSGSLCISAFRPN